MIKGNKKFMQGTGIVAVAILIIGAIYIFSQPGEGTRLEFNGGELFFTENIQQPEAEKLGSFLVNEVAYFDGRPKSVQIDKKDTTYIFRAVIIEGVEKDSANIAPFEAMGQLISEKVFNGAPVHVEMCNAKFKTLRSIPFHKQNTENL